MYNSMYCCTAKFDAFPRMHSHTVEEVSYLSSRIFGNSYSVLHSSWRVCTLAQVSVLEYCVDSTSNNSTSHAEVACEVLLAIQYS